MLPRLFAFLVFLAVRLSFADVPGGSTDPIFADLNFDHWSEKDPGAHFRWTTHISPPRLSSHQRLMVTVEVQVDGAERVKRQGQGDMVMMVEFRDAAGNVYQNHNSISLAKVDREAVNTETVYSQRAFVVPGEYQVATGVVVTGTKEHAIAHKTLRVDPLRRDPLPDAWRDVPAVEFLPDDDPPDGWFLPTVTGHLKLDVDTKRPVHIDLLVNESTTEEMSQTRFLRRGGVNLGPLIASVKVFSGVKLSNGSFEVTMLDLERKRVSFEQTTNGSIDWTKLRDSLDSANPHKIDIGSLEHRDENARFFLSEVQKRAAGGEGSDSLHVFILLSRPMAFDKSSASPIQVAADRNTKIYFIRYTPSPIFLTEMGPVRMRGFPADVPQYGAGRGRISFPNSSFSPPADELFGLLKPLDPRLFDVSTPAEFRKALGAILSDIARVAGN